MELAACKQANYDARYLFVKYLSGKNPIFLKKVSFVCPFAYFKRIRRSGGICVHIFIMEEDSEKNELSRVVEAKHG